jgi:hypothetical protein
VGTQPKADTKETGKKCTNQKILLRLGEDADSLEIIVPTKLELLSKASDDGITDAVARVREHKISNAI